MTIQDNFLLFSDAQAFTTGSENGIKSTSSIDLGVLGRNIGVGEDLYVMITVPTAFTGTNPNSTTVALQTDDNAAINSGTTIATLATIATNSVAGTTLFAKLPISTLYERYISLLYTAANALSTGAISASIVNGVDVKTYYAQSTGSVIATS